MTYAELTRKYMLKEITEEEYKRGKQELIYRLFDLYEESIIDEKVLRERIEKLKEEGNNIESLIDKAYELIEML